MGTSGPAPQATADPRERVVELLGRLLAQHWLRRRQQPGLHSAETARRSCPTRGRLGRRAVP